MDYGAKKLQCFALHQGTYGQSGIKAVKSLAEAHDICIAYAREIDRARGHVEFRDTAKALMR